MDLLEQQKKTEELIALAMEAVEARLVKAKVESLDENNVSYFQELEIGNEATPLMKVIFEHYFSPNYPKGKSFNELINEQCVEFSKKEIIFKKK